MIWQLHIEICDRITRLIPGRILFRDYYAKSYYVLGKCYERKGEPVRAIESYHTFLDLWKDSDPGLPEVADARARLAAIS